jgi:hypothetical protein
MNDILMDVQEEFNAAEVGLVQLWGAIRTNQEDTIKQDGPEDIHTLKSNLPTLVDDPCIITSTEHADNVEHSFSAQKSEPRVHAAGCGSCNSTKQKCSCQHAPSQNASYDTNIQSQPIVASAVHSNGPSILQSHYANRSALVKSDRMIWFCSECGDGPRGSWNSQCSSCSHLMCYHCVVEET